jgi:putative membrane protein
MFGSIAAARDRSLPSRTSAECRQERLSKGLVTAAVERNLAMRPCLAIISPIVFGLAACGSNSADQQAPAADPEATATAIPAAVGSQTAQLPLTAQAFVDAVSASDKFEIESARIVQGTGPGQPLTAFTQMMLRDHQTSTNELKKAANFAGGPAFPDDQKLTAEQEANLAALRSAGPELGTLYLRQQVAAHEKTLAVLKTYAASGDNQTLMGFATKMIPIVSHHLAEVRALKL